MNNFQLCFRFHLASCPVLLAVLIISRGECKYQFVGEFMAVMGSIKEMIQCATLGIPKGMKKCDFFFYCIDFLSEMNHFQEMRKKKPFEIILHVG